MEGTRGGDVAPADLVTNTLQGMQVETDAVRARVLKYRQPVPASVPGPKAKSWWRGRGVRFARGLN